MHENVKEALEKIFSGKTARMQGIQTKINTDQLTLNDMDNLQQLALEFEQRGHPVDVFVRRSGTGLVVVTTFI